MTNVKQVQSNKDYYNSLILTNPEDHTKCRLDLGPGFGKNTWNEAVPGIIWAVRVQPKCYPEEGWFPSIQTMEFKTGKEAKDWQIKVITGEVDYLKEYDWITDPFIRQVN